jgi:protein-tyrosine phosphatase
MTAVDWWQNRSQNEARAHRTSRPSLAEITQHLLIGEYPRSDDIGWLRDSYHITAVHNLQDDDDVRLHGLDLRAVRDECDANDIRFLRTPIQDGSADAMAERLRVAIDDLHSLIADGNRVYLHCNAGLNRAPTLAIGYLRAHGKMSLDEAVAHVKKHRACGPFMTILEDYFGPRHIKPK